MPRFLIERTFPEGLSIPVNVEAAVACLGVMKNNAKEGVSWVHSYVSGDRTRTFCIYDGPSPDAVRRAAERNGLRVDGMTEVRVLDPYFYW